MKIASGVTDQYIYFVAVDSTDFTSRETGFSSFTVYRSRDGAAAAVMTTPTINETDSSNMPGVYELLLDEDMTIGAGNDTEEMAFHITHAGMAPVTRTIELYRPAFTTQMADSIPADGTIPTREQALYMITQFLLERSVSSTTVTVKKADGSTSLMTLTLDSHIWQLLH